jgi:hypothetical protein
MKPWLLIRPDEDGNPCRWLDDNDVRELLANPRDHGVETFLTEPPDRGPNYWPDGSVLRLKVEAVVPKPAVTAYVLP